MIYQNGSLKEILTPEGYIENGVYYYYLQDHQGNNRVVINSSGVVQEYSNYYPDGMRFWTSTSNSAAIPFRYNNKEFEAMNGLNQYDYGARRKYSWGSVLPTIDPHCEKYYCPYAYCMNNPVRLIDPNGKDWVMNNDTKKYEWQDNVTTKGNTPKGYTYVGHENNDILKSLGVKSSYSGGQNRKSISLGGDKADPAPVNSRAGAVASTLLPAAEGLTKGEKAQATILISPLVSQGKATDNNKSGFTFDGVGITGILTQPISNLTATGGGLEVTNGGKEYTRGPLMPANVNNNISQDGYITTSVSGRLSADKLFPGSLQSANISAGTTDNGTLYIAPVSISFDLQDDK
jgi:RHS repeat-associated protein